MKLKIFLAAVIAVCSASLGLAETADPRFPAGTMGEPEGTVAVVSIFADDAKFDWDLDRKRDQQNYEKAYEGLRHATEYLTKEIGKYGRRIRFVWDWDEDEDLFYTAEFKTNLGNSINNSSAGVFEADEFISENVDTDGIMKSTGADNIIYLFFINSDGSEKHSSCSFWAGTDPSDSQKDYYYTWERQGEKPAPYEYCFLFMNDVTAAVMAHEMIHTFAVPDLYGEADFGVTEELAAYLKKINLNDIMRATSANLADPYRIPTEITEITAYYMGLTDHSDIAEQFGLKPSTHAKEYSQSRKVPETKFVDIPIFDPSSGTVTFFEGAAPVKETPKASIFVSEFMDGKQIPVESDVLTITDEDADEDDMFPITLTFAVKGNNSLKISAVLNFDDDRTDEEALEVPNINQSRNKITYDGVIYGVTFEVTATKSRGSFDANDEKILMQAFKTTGNYAAVLLNMIMED